MLTDPRQRLITILGPGGIGKTRLAMEVATAQLPIFDEHVYFIQLAAFNSSDVILPAIAATFNLHSTVKEELITHLVDFLRGNKVLLVLDNFEHLIDGASQVSRLLQSIPQLKVGWNWRSVSSKRVNSTRLWN